MGSCKKTEPIFWGVCVCVCVWGGGEAPFFFDIFDHPNYPKELAQEAVCQSHTGHMTGLWCLSSPAFKAEY